MNARPWQHAWAALPVVTLTAAGLAGFPVSEKPAGPTTHGDTREALLQCAFDGPALALHKLAASSKVEMPLAGRSAVELPGFESIAVRSAREPWMSQQGGPLIAPLTGPITRPRNSDNSDVGLLLSSDDDDVEQDPLEVAFGIAPSSSARQSSDSGWGWLANDVFARGRDSRTDRHDMMTERGTRFGGYGGNRRTARPQTPEEVLSLGGSAFGTSGR